MQNKLNSINNLVDELYQLSVDQDEDIVSLKKLENRDSILEALQETRAHLTKIIGNLDTKIDKLETVHRNQLSRLKNALGESPQPRQESSWKVISKGKQRAVSLEKVPITDRLYLSAIVVSQWKELKNMREGVLYYVSSADNFAIKINGFLYHGNIGHIFSSESNPTKIKACKYGKECSKENCNYYHDPLTTPDSFDRRNFVASSWTYAPPDDKARNKKKTRKIGSLDNLEIDLQLLKQDDADKFLAQTMHDLLCSFIIKKYKASE